MNSNITLKSNIYINKTDSRDDWDFLQHITDFRVLKRYAGNSVDWWRTTTWMTNVQKEVLECGSPDCTYEHGTMSWGVPVGSERFVCRCEEYSCPKYGECKNLANYERIERKMQESPDTDKADKKTEVLFQSAVDVQQDEQLNPSNCADIAEQEMVSENAVNEQEMQAKPITAAQNVAATDTAMPAQMEGNQAVNENAALRIVEQEQIIAADSDARIWVNAGPGTGKTYTVIQRLKKLLQEEYEGTILVLCFSKNAVQVIRNRLHDTLGYQADQFLDEKRLEIRTFDSFATYMLADELNSKWNYDTRIEEFIRMIQRNPGVLDEILHYVIVDEVQDTVGVRARMLLKILDDVKCGVLLLGDRCQAIFDWTSREKHDMSFADLAAELQKRHLIQYELSGNKRQSKELAQKGEEIRGTMLLEDETTQKAAIDAFKSWANLKWKSYDMKELPKQLHGAEDLILCKTNGEAAHISQILFENADVPHVMKQAFRHKSLAPWIAKVLFGSDGKILEKHCFMKNAEEFEIDEAEGKWRTLKAMDDHPHAPGLHIPEVLSTLSHVDGLPAVCLNNAGNSAVVSTVHRAKGSEAEHVYWVDSPYAYKNQAEQEENIADALKAAYVAITRAKEDVHMLKSDDKFRMKCIPNNRWIQTGISSNKRSYCKGIAMEAGDVCPDSFADREFAKDAQAALARLEPGMVVDLWANEKRRCFDIYFDGQQIGRTSEAFTNALFAGFEATNHTRNWPNKITDVYVAAVTTEISTGSSTVAEKYSKTGCWLGIELGGFPILEWY